MTISEYEVRKQKVQALRDLGVLPYAHKYNKTHMISELLTHKDDSGFRDSTEIVSNPKSLYKTAGRLTLFRAHGSLSFARLLDESGEIQLMFHKDNCLIDEADASAMEKWNISAYKLLEKLIDVGDFIGVEGELFITHKGELTLFVHHYTFLSKAIQPLGDKFHGIGEDQEKSYRQRYLDMIFNQDTLRRMKLRSKFLRVIREFYRSQGFIEVETPVLGNAASGAAARPFVTHHHDFDLDMYLRISPETNLKKATVGMLEKIFEVAKDFRNEGSDPSHHQEFTMIEHYAAYRDHEDNMRFTEQMFDYIFTHIPELKQTINVTDKQGVTKEVSLQTPRERIDYVAQIRKDSGIDVSAYSEGDDDQLRADIKTAGHTREGIDKQGLVTMIDYLYKKVTRPKIVWPAFIVNYPKLMQPLARTSNADDKLVEQRQLLINGREVIKAYSELVDPVEQQANFDAQAAALEAWDEEATAGDPEFVQAMEYGMPPQSGRGMGIDRIFALLTEQSNIRDVILFPMMKPIPQSGDHDSTTSTSAT
jgi:lysyl-tRNA synthetase, class II